MPTVHAITEAVIDFDRRVHSAPLDWYSIDDTSDAILIYPQAEAESSVDLGEKNAKVLEQYLLLKDEIKQANEALALITVDIQKKMGNHAIATVPGYTVKWPMKNYKAQPEKIIPAKPATSSRQSTITVKEVK